MPNRINRTFVQSIGSLARNPSIVRRTTNTVADLTVVTTPGNSVTFEPGGSTTYDPGDLGIPDWDPTDLPQTVQLQTIRIVRPDDLLNGFFQFHNLQHNPLFLRAQKIDPSKPAYLSLNLPGQHFGEQTIAENATPVIPLRARLAGRSRIAVKMPNGDPGPVMTTAGLLDALTRWPLSLDPLAYSTWGGLSRSTLQSVSETFSDLTVDLTLHLGNLGAPAAAWYAPHATSSEAETAFGQLNAETSTGQISQKARAIRSTIENKSHAYAVNAKSNAPAGSTSAQRSEIAETAEALYEVWFALHLARKLISSRADFSPLQYWSMSGLFDLMMHPHMPAETSTALELPYRLITSPGSNTVFQHSGPAISGAYDRGSRVELWHSRLRRDGDPPRDLGPEGTDLFALWSPDYNLEEGKPDFSGPGTAASDEGLSLNAEQRRWIVQRTTGHNEEQHNTIEGHYYRPVPAKVREMVLTPLGATLDAEGKWPDESSLYPGFGRLTGWLHQASYGRDQNVVVTEAGWIYPMGFPATKVTVTERKFRPIADGDHAAALHKRIFLVINKAVLDFPESGQRFAGRGLPFSRMTAVTRVTPNLDDSTDISGIPGAFWVHLEGGGPRLAFEFEGTDPAGRTIGMKLAQIWVPGGFETAGNTPVGLLANAWDTAALRSRLNGQIVRLMAGGESDLDLPVQDILFGADAISGNVSTAVINGKRPFHPAVRGLKARIPALSDLAGSSPTTVREISFAQNYLDGALGQTVTPVVLELTDPVDLDFAGDLTSDAMGAIGQANQQIRALADGLGPVPLPDGGNLNLLAQGQVNWEDLLPDFKVLGRFALHQLLDVINVGPTRMPTFRTERSEHEIVRKWEMHESIRRSAVVGPATLSPRGSSEIYMCALAAITIDTLKVEAEAGSVSVNETIPAGLPEARAEARGWINNFDIDLFEIIEVRFDSIGFDVIAGKKPKTHVRMHASDPLVFHGPLEFLNQLKDLIPPRGLDNGPRIIPGPLGIEARFDMALPNLVLGVFALKNMDLGASTVLPFDQRPLELKFNFNERHRPFELAVAGLGGGGFFALEVDAGGIREIEAALEFGAVASMSIGVASGSISIKGGVYFRFTSDELVLEGYVELRGKMSVLGLITASLLFHMALAYIKRGQRSLVRGEATLRIEVEVLFFSTSVTLHVEREFKAGTDDPRIAEMMGGSDWKAYCNAFA